MGLPASASCFSWRRFTILTVGVKRKVGRVEGGGGRQWLSVKCAFYLMVPCSLFPKPNNFFFILYYRTSSLSTNVELIISYNGWFLQLTVRKRSRKSYYIYLLWYYYSFILFYMMAKTGNNLNLDKQNNWLIKKSFKTPLSYSFESDTNINNMIYVCTTRKFKKARTWN